MPRNQRSALNRIITPNINLSSLDTALEIIRGLLSNNKHSKQDVCKTTIILLKPFVGRTIPKKVPDTIQKDIDRIVKNKGICTTCYSNKLKYINDEFCDRCKSAIKEKFKSLPAQEEE